MPNIFTIFPRDTVNNSGQGNAGPLNAPPGSGIYRVLIVENLGPETAWLNRDRVQAIPFPDNWGDDWFTPSVDSPGPAVIPLGSGVKVTLVVTGSQQWWYGTWRPGATLLVTEKS